MGGKSALHDIGKRFGRLVVIKVEVGGPAIVTAKCDCGELWTGRVSPLRDGRVKSCGCLNSDLTSERNKTHGLSKLPEYKVWKGINRRVNDKGHTDYPNYGGRGVKICERWHEFSNFIEDMGPRPTPAHSIDRVDSNGDYCKENCRWATPIEQGRNTRRVNRHEYAGKSMTLKEVAEAAGVPYYALKSRLMTQSLDVALSTPFKKSKAGELITAHGLTMTLSQWAKHLGVGITTIAYRLSQGWPVETALASAKAKQGKVRRA